MWREEVPKTEGQLGDIPVIQHRVKALLGGPMGLVELLEVVSIAVHGRCLVHVARIIERQRRGHIRSVRRAVRGHDVISRIYLWLGHGTGALRPKVDVAPPPNEDVGQGQQQKLNTKHDQAPPPGVPGLGTEDGRNREGDDGHQLDQDVERRAGGVLEGVADGVARDGRLVHVRALPAERLLNLDVLLGVVPGPAGVGHLHRQHEPRPDGPDKQPTQRRGAHQKTHPDRREHGQDPGGHHLPDGGLGGDADALLNLRLHARLAIQQPGDLPELAPDLLDDRGRGLLDGQHREGSKHEGQHRADDREGHHDRVQQAEVRCVQVGAFEVRRQQGDGRQHGGPDGEALAGGGRGVAQGVQRVRPLTHLLGALGHLGDPARVVRDGPVRVGGKGHPQGGQHTDGGDRDPVRAEQGVAGQQGGNDDERRGHAGQHPDAKALDDDGGVAQDPGLRNGRGGGVTVGREHLGHLADQNASHQADADARKGLPAVHV
mmetsp:Transcript_88980/g.154311  ORF Transcript_88980/g.154311 Transcript_88980/m.154311 type:complete len:488 (+) Transcript_88980:469-1932(+)